jgi:2-oxoglutarate ferredoxin oxidoreductase subunit alpha
VLRSYERVLVPEMNMGQLSRLLRAEYLVDVESYTKVDGLPIFPRDVMEQVTARLAPEGDVPLTRGARSPRNGSGA